MNTGKTKPKTKQKKVAMAGNGSEITDFEGVKIKKKGKKHEGGGPNVLNKR